HTKRLEHEQQQHMNHEQPKHHVMQHATLGFTSVSTAAYQLEANAVTEYGGERGIRTPGTASGTTDFESAALDHSAISPRPAANNGFYQARTSFSCPPM